jgi:sodium/bile acid cotransporter 7
MARPRFLPDNFTLALCGVVALASLLPARGAAETVVGWVANLAIALLFFFHGAKLSREAVLRSLGHWRLHLLILGCTFGLFPLLGLALKPLLIPLVGDALYRGILYLCVLPATVQSAIAFTSLARGNVAASICSAAASSLLGIFLTPLLVTAVMGVHGETGSAWVAVQKIAVQLLLPFVAGQVARRWIGGWVDRNKAWLKNVDQSSILLVIYLAFGEAVNQHLWQRVSPPELIGLMVVCVLLLALVLFLVGGLARLLGFSLEDRITILFGGSKKSLAAGVPMAQVLFPAASIGVMILPLMIFHQIQLMVCAVLAQRYARRPQDSAEPGVVAARR